MRPSEILQIPQWEASTQGTDGWWTSYQVDNAVAYFGIWADNKLAELDDNGKAKWSLEHLLKMEAGARMGSFKPRKK